MSTFCIVGRRFQCPREGCRGRGGGDLQIMLRVDDHFVYHACLSPGSPPTPPLRGRLCMLVCCRCTMCWDVSLLIMALACRTSRVGQGLTVARQPRSFLSDKRMSRTSRLGQGQTVTHGSLTCFLLDKYDELITCHPRRVVFFLPSARTSRFAPS